MDLIVAGQGVLFFTGTSFCLVNKDGDGLDVEITPSCVNVKCIQSLEPLIDKNSTGLTSLEGAYYWFSLDSQNQMLYAGVGEARLETIIYKYKAENMLKFFESITTIKTDMKIRLLKDPVTATVPLLVKDTHHLTMHHIASNKYMPKANLSPICQQLYDCISGKNFILDDKDFPDFSKAIERSITTPGLWCYNRLQEKSREFSHDPNILETYLRITLNQNNGESPGIPYVMEIWPSGHYSPIHNHAGANAIIRVLHGKIHVKLFPFLCPNGTDISFAEADFNKDEITWISPTLNQTHQLTNLDKKSCVTIQCYMYDQNDKKHYDYFDYIGDDHKTHQYTPDSDMDFLKFKELMKEEWFGRPKIEICPGLEIKSPWFMNILRRKKATNVSTVM